MTMQLIHESPEEIYPGIFVPSCDKHMISDSFKNSRAIIRKPMVNIIDKGNIVCVEMIIPGVKREEFFIEGKNNILNVSVYHNEMTEEAKEFRTREFDCCKFQREIVLPENADLSFVSATYDSGILKIQVPKSNKIINDFTTRIAVY
jgi:HSP20 family protein